MRTLASLILFALLAGPGFASEPEPQPAPGEEKIDLDLSFRIPQEKGHGISHTPAVVFTKDGRRMLTATSTGQVVVFDTKTRKVLRKLRLSEAGTDGIAIDASGRYVAWVPKKGGLAVMEIESGEIVARDPKLATKWVAISPDARLIALTHGKTVEVRKLATLELVGEAVTTDGEVTNVAWSPNGKLLGWTTGSGHVVVREPEAGRNVCAVKKGAAMHAIAFTPDSAFVAYGGQDNQVHHYAFATGKEELITKGQPYWITCLGYSPDGKLIAVGDESCDIWLYDVAKKERKFHNKHHVECWLNSVAWAPDNETFLFGCRPNSHAGKPHLHMPLTLAEARRSPEARASRERLLAAIDAELGRTKDKKEKDLLVSYRTQLAREEEVQQAGAIAFSGQAAAAGNGTIEAAGGVAFESWGTGAGVGTKTPTISPQTLPASLRQIAEEHGKTVQAEMKKLQSDFCVNQWKVK
ncbi:MAG: WD40 repeat domain-containing protein [Planctomycetota bacterium]|jgi:hypothetical protein